MKSWAALLRLKDGQEIVYTVDETKVPDGYTKTKSGDAKTGFVIKNSHETEDTAVKVTKKWADADDQDGIRPDSVKVQLYADGEPYEGQVTLDESNNWTKVWSELDKFKERSVSRIGIRTALSKYFNNMSSGNPFVSLPNNKNTSSHLL